MASHSIVMVAEIREEIAIEPPHISTEEFDTGPSAYCVDVQQSCLRAATDAHYSELSEEVIVFLLRSPSVSRHHHIGVQGLQLLHSLLGPLRRGREGKERVYEFAKCKQP